MHKILLIILLSMASNCAVAEWVRVSINETDTFYADPATIIKSAYKVKMQTLDDFKTATKAAGIHILSTVVQEEYDCSESHSRALFYAFYSKNMGKGRKVHTDTEPHKWEPVRPGTAREALWMFACKKR